MNRRSIKPPNRPARFASRAPSLVLLLSVLLPGAALCARQTPSWPQAQQQPAAPPKQSQTQSPPQAQSPTQPPTAPSKIAVQTNMVTVFASVRDKKGHILSDLSKDDFALDEDGKPQTVTYFAREDQLPLTVGLLVDTSLSQRVVLGDERTASAAFIDHTLREEMKDKAFLIHFDYEVELLQDLTTSRQKLDSALNLLQISQREEDTSSSQDPDQQGGRRGRYGHGGGGTHLYDAVYLASDELMAKQQGRKALIILSDGVDRGSKETLSSSIEAAQRANTIVYSILFKGEDPSENFGRRGGWRMGGPGMGGPGYGGPGYGGGQRRYPRGEERPDGKKILERMSKETGGRLFEVSKKQPVDQIYTQITEELRDQYVLGYVPPKSDDSGYHKIIVTAKKKDLIVQARDGYYWNPSATTGQ